MQSLLVSTSISRTSVVPMFDHLTVQHLASVLTFL